MKQKRYNREFKQTIVELYRSGTSVSDLNREYGVSEVTIYKWLKAPSPIENSGGLAPTEIAEIQKENLRLQQEIEILKRAMTILSLDDHLKNHQNHVENESRRLYYRRELMDG